MRHQDKIFLEFPLSVLSYNDDNWIDMLISYSIVEYAEKLKNEPIKQTKFDDLPYGYNKNNNTHLRVMTAAQELRITLGDINHTIKKHQVLSFHVVAQRGIYGKSPYCRIGKALCFDAREGFIDQISFRVLCAVQSKIGKIKNYKRIYRDEIMCRMQGYKTKKDMIDAGVQEEKLISYKKLKSKTDFLEAKKLISRFTYAKRITYYSTRLSKEGLISAVEKDKLFWAEKKFNIVDQEGTKKIKNLIAGLTNKRKDNVLQFLTDELRKGKMSI